MTMIVEGEDAGVSYSWNTDLWMGKDSIRGDRDVRGESLDGTTPKRKVVLVDKTYITWSDERLKGDGKYVARVEALASEKELDEKPFQMMNPRFLGLTPMDLESASRDSHEIAYVGSKWSEKGVVSKDLYNGEECLKVEYEIPGFDEKVTYWVSPERGWNVVRIEQLAVPFGTKNEILDSVVLWPEQDMASKVWFPTRSEYRRIETGGNVTRSETISIENAQFNMEVPSEVYSLRGLGIPKGTTVVSTGIDKDISTGMWNGHEIIPNDYTMQEADIADQGDTRKLGIIISSIACMVLGTMVLWKWYKSQE